MIKALEGHPSKAQPYRADQSLYALIGLMLVLKVAVSEPEMS